MNREEMIWFFFSYKTVVITLNESYLALSRNRWKIRATRSIRKKTKPDRKDAGTIVRKSIIPSKENKKCSLACPGEESLQSRCAGYIPDRK